MRTREEIKKDLKVIEDLYLEKNCRQMLEIYREKSRPLIRELEELYEAEKKEREENEDNPVNDNLTSDDSNPNSG